MRFVGKRDVPEKKEVEKVEDKVEVTIDEKKVAEKVVNNTERKTKKTKIEK